MRREKDVSHCLLATLRRGVGFGRRPFLSNDLNINRLASTSASGFDSKGDLLPDAEMTPVIRQRGVVNVYIGTKRTFGPVARPQHGDGRPGRARRGHERGASIGLGSPDAARSARPGRPVTFAAKSAWAGLPVVFFLADAQVGFGPLIAVYLTAQKWTQADIGLVLTIGGLVALIGQMPGGALVDAARSERVVAAFRVQ